MPSQRFILSPNQKTWLSFMGLAVVFSFGMFCVLFLK